MLVRLFAGLVIPALAFGWGRERVIIDTDSGLFGDDGAAMVMLARNPDRVTIRGIVVTPGNVWVPQGVEHVFHIFDLLRQPNIPVHTGATVPLIHTPAMAREMARRWGALNYVGAFDDDPNAEVKPAPGSLRSARVPASRRAVDYLISEIERNPGDITILELAPMTNLALALRMKPEIETKIRRVIFMGGNFRVAGNASDAAEFNFWFDPEAARIVLRSRIPEKVMFGLDICNTAPIRRPEFESIAAVRTPITDLFREDLGRRYPAFYRNPAATIYMWDSLAAAYLLDPGFVTKWETVYLDVQTAWGQYYGATVPLERALAPEATPVKRMLSLDYQRVFRLFSKLLTQK